MPWRVICLFFLCLIFRTSLAQPDEVELWGNWVDLAYINNLEATRSPYQARQSLGEVSEFAFRKEWGDSVLVIFGGHEGVIYPFFRNGTEIVINQVGILNIEGLGSQHYLSWVPPGEEPRLYRRYADPEQGHSAIPSLVHDLLFSGVFEPYNPNQATRSFSVHRVNLQTSSVIKGLPGIEKFEVLTDFDDIADFDVGKANIRGQQQWMGWEFRRDTLLLYELVPADTYRYRKGQVYQRLIHYPD